jgi:ATP synthase protein I
MADQSPDYDKKVGGREDRRHGDRRLEDRRIGERRQRDRRQKEKKPEDNTRQRDNSRFWYDFMRFNLTGWSVVIPTLVGLALGNWIDQRNPRGFSWTLTLMAAGLFLGCLNAWYWIRHQDHNGRNK